MKSKLLLLSALFFLGANISSAQLSVRENNPSVLKTGTRPLAGSFGMFIGPSLSEIQDIADNNVEFRGLPLLNIKHYLTDRVEARVGIQLHKKKQIFEGELTNSEAGLSIDNNSESHFRLVPGLAYHFSPYNIMDVYAGVGIPVGTDKHKIETRWEDTDTGDFMENSIQKSTIVYGFTLFFGFQAFIADLPMAIGIEYGISSLTHSGLEYQYEVDQKIGTSSSNQTYYTKDDNGWGNTYKELKYKESEIGGEIRITLSYFFDL